MDDRIIESLSYHADKDKIIQDILFEFDSFILIKKKSIH